MSHSCKNVSVLNNKSHQRGALTDKRAAESKAVIVCLVSQITSDSVSAHWLPASWNYRYSLDTIISLLTLGLAAL